MKGFDEYYDEAVEPGKRERAFAWATAIGLQDVDGLKPSKYLIKTAKRHIEGEISAAEARKLVDEYYETKIGHDRPEDEKEAEVDLRRRGVGIKSSDDVINDAINDAIKLSESEESVKAEIERDCHVSAARIAERVGLKQRQIQRIIAALKKKAGLCRRGAKKNGEWYFEGKSLNKRKEQR